VYQALSYLARLEGDREPEVHNLDVFVGIWRRRFS
jgi:hypothetical protein